MGLAQFLLHLGPIAVGSMALGCATQQPTFIHSLFQTPVAVHDDSSVCWRCRIEPNKEIPYSCIAYVLVREGRQSSMITIFNFIYFWAAPCIIQDHSSPSRDRTTAPE